MQATTSKGLGTGEFEEEARQMVSVDMDQDMQEAILDALELSTDALRAAISRSAAPADLQRRLDAITRAVTLIAGGNIK